MPEERPGLGLVEHCPDETCAANHRCREYPLYEERCPIYGEADFTGEWKKRVESISIELAEAITAREEAEAAIKSAIAIGRAQNDAGRTHSSHRSGSSRLRASKVTKDREAWCPRCEKRVPVAEKLTRIRCAEGMIDVLLHRPCGTKFAIPSPVSPVSDTTRRSTPV